MPEPDHAHASTVLNDALDVCRRHGCVRRVEANLILPDDGVPIPDLVIARGSTNDYRDRYAEAADTLCVIEVADTTLAKDRNEKLPLYARDGVPMYVIVAIPEDVVQVYRQPLTDSYGSLVTLGRGDVLRLPMADGAEVEVPVNDLLPVEPRPTAVRRR